MQPENILSPILDDDMMAMWTNAPSGYEYVFRLHFNASIQVLICGRYLAGQIGVTISQVWMLSCKLWKQIPPTAR